MTNVIVANENISGSGYINWELEDIFTNNIVSDGISNILVNTTREKLADFMKGDSISAPSFIGLGTGLPTSFQFDGSLSSIDFSSPSVLDNVFASGGSVEFLINVISDGEGDNGRIFDKTKWYIKVSDESGGAVRLTLFTDWSSTNGEWELTSRDIVIGTTYHIIIVYDSDSVGNNPIFYINGVAKTVGNGLTEVTTPIGSFVSDASDNLVLCNESGGTRAFHGNIDETALYSDEITSVEALSHYNESILLTNGYAVEILADNPVGYWRFNEIDGETAKDSSVNSSPGTISDVLENQTSLLSVIAEIPAASDTDLQTPIKYNGSSFAKDASLRETRATFNARIVTQFSTSEGNFNIRELGLFDAADSGDMWARVSVIINKTSSQRLTVYWNIAFRRGTGVPIKTGSSIGATGVITAAVDSELSFVSTITMMFVHNNSGERIYFRINTATIGGTSPTEYDFILEGGEDIVFSEEEIGINTIHVMTVALAGTMPLNKLITFRNLLVISSATITAQCSY